MSDFFPGDHLVVGRGLYSHHGIYVGSSRVIHYSGELGRKVGARVKESALRTFADGGEVEVLRYQARFAAATVVRRARSRLGEREYSLVFNNCEHFATWCRTDEAASEQVRGALRALFPVLDTVLFEPLTLWVK